MNRKPFPPSPRPRPRPSWAFENENENENVHEEEDEDDLAGIWSPRASADADRKYKQTPARLKARHCLS